MSESTRERLANYGKWTYRAAWALEITAALIGLATGLILGFQASVNAGGTEAVNLVLASAPFFMVALAELTKIPIATLLYAVSWMWKPLLLVFLGSLALITFETVSMGLERAATLRQLPYNEMVKTIGILSAESESLKANIRRLQETDEVADAQKDIERIGELADKERQDLQEQLEAINRQMAGGATSESVILIQNQIREAEDRRSQLIDERERRIKERVSEFERQRASFENRIRDARDRGEEGLAQDLQQQLARLKNPTPAITAEYADRITQLDATILEYEKTLRSIRDAARKDVNTRAKDLEQQRNAIEAQLSETNRKWSDQLQSARERLAQAQSTASSQDAEISKSKQRIGELESEVASLDGKRIALATEDQIRRLAGRIYGTTPDKVSDEQASFVSVVWFGSLAGLAALAGPLTAMVALALQNLGSSERQESRLSRTIRGAIVSWRRNRKKAKSSSGTAAVPQERVVKEILYVPVLTNDPAQVRDAIAKDLPKEVSDLVRLSMKEEQVGNPA
jgi:hypothetical protein